MFIQTGEALKNLISASWCSFLTFKVRNVLTIWIVCLRICLSFNILHRGGIPKSIH